MSNGGSDEELNLVKSAKAVLLDATKRNEYNAVLDKYGLKDGTTSEENFEVSLKKRKEGIEGSLTSLEPKV